MIEAQQAFVSDFITQAFGLPIAYENDDYDPTPGTPWVAIRTFPGQTFPGAIAGTQPEQAGFFQFVLNYPTGEGAMAAKLKAQDIFDAYPIARRVTYGGEAARVTSYQQFDTSPQGGWFQLVGRIFYELE